MSTALQVEKKRRTYQACCDIYEEKGNVVLQMEMPGVVKDNLDIRVDGDRLIIHGKKVLPKLDGEYKIKEIKEGDYYHEYTIDDTIDRQKIDAAIKNGVVTLTLAIKEAEKPRKIKVAIG